MSNYARESVRVVPAQAGTHAEHALSERVLSMGPRFREDDT
jgi:hypothetical protein